MLQTWNKKRVQAIEAAFVRILVHVFVQSMHLEDPLDLTHQDLRLKEARVSNNKWKLSGFGVVVLRSGWRWFHPCAPPWQDVDLRLDTQWVQKLKLLIQNKIKTQTVKQYQISMKWGQAVQIKQEFNCPVGDLLELEESCWGWSSNLLDTGAEKHTKAEARRGESEGKCTGTENHSSSFWVLR